MTTTKRPDAPWTPDPAEFGLTEVPGSLTRKKDWDRRVLADAGYGMFFYNYKHGTVEIVVLPTQPDGLHHADVARDLSTRVGGTVASPPLKRHPHKGSVVVIENYPLPV